MTVEMLASKLRNSSVSQLLRAQAAGQPEISPALVYKLCEEARSRMRVDIAAAVAAAEAAYAAARAIADPPALAEALRLRGHVSYLSGRYRQAATAYRRAIAILDRLGKHVDVGRTLSSALQTLIYLGRYDEALDWAARARQVFQAEGDSLRLARLDSNIGNILHRQDRYTEALALYRQAVDGLHACGDPDSAAIALRNLAVCHTELHDFDNALTAYRQAEGIYRQKGLPLLAAEIDDNIAHLHYLRGDYLQALSLYRSSDVADRGNTYHLAIARLDQSDLLLELNLFTEAAALAADAAQRLAELGIRYEQGKALVNLALASFRLPDAAAEAMPLLNRAKALFRRENNPGWIATADYCRADLLLESNQCAAARQAAFAAVEVLDRTALLSKTVLALLLLARIDLKEGRVADARLHYQRAAARCATAATLPLRFQLALTAGALFEAEDNPNAAWAEYQSARAIIELIRLKFTGDGLRISFLSGKQIVYERLVHLAASGQVAGIPIDATFALVEQAKSRTLAESMAPSPPAAAATSAEASQVEAVRQQLSWCYRQLDRAEAARESPSAESLDSLRRRTAACEQRLTTEFNLRSGSSPLSLEASPPSAAASIERLQSGLPPSGALLEYFAAGDLLYLFVVTSGEVHCVPLGSFAEVDRTCRLLRFQMARRTLGTTGPDPISNAWLAATTAHLRSLYRLLIEPAAQALAGTSHWVIVPHGPLHRIPFHALHDGDASVIDRRTVSYAPSAAVFLLCQQKSAASPGPPVVFGVPDDLAPYIREEAQMVAARLPQAQLFLAADATSGRLQQAAASANCLHLATHGIARQDNPLFSSIRLGDSRLCLYDLDRFTLQAELVTLSGCATGVHETQGAGEIMGLARGLLTAGAHTVQLSLWEVSDRSTAFYMSHFYSQLCSGLSAVAASRQAMLATRQSYPHPFHWAPFALTGKVKEFPPGIFYSHQVDPIKASIK